MYIRRESPSDISSVADVHRQAFEGDEPAEVALLDALRNDPSWIPPLSLVGLLGHLDYHPRFGFVPAASVGVAPDEPDRATHFQVRTLAAWTPDTVGTFRYADPFYSL